MRNFRTDSEKYTSQNQKQSVHTISTDVCQDLANSECTSSTWQQWAHLNESAQAQSRIWVSRRSSTQKGGTRTPRLTTEALAARADSLQHLRQRVAASISRSVCPASSSTATPVGGPEEEGDFRRRIKEYILHDEYYKSVTGKDGEEPLDALGSPTYTDMGSYPTDLADTVSRPRQPRGPVWRPEPLITSRSPEVCPAYVKDPHLPEPTHRALDRTAELLAKLLSGSEDADVTALAEPVKAKLGITEPLPQPALASPSPGLSTLAEDLKRSRVCRLLRKVTCPSPFHPRTRTVPMAELQDVPVTETEKRGLSAQARVAGVPPPLPSRPNPRGSEEWQTYCSGERLAGIAGVRPERSAQMGRRIC